MRCRRRQTILDLIFEPVLLFGYPNLESFLAMRAGREWRMPSRLKWHASSKSYLTAYGKRLRTGCWHQLPLFKGRGRKIETAPMPTKKTLDRYRVARPSRNSEF